MTEILCHSNDIFFGNVSFILGCFKNLFFDLGIQKISFEAFSQALLRAYPNCSSLSETQRILCCPQGENFSHLRKYLNKLVILVRFLIKMRAMLYHRVKSYTVTKTAKNLQNCVCVLVFYERGL